MALSARIRQLALEQAIDTVVSASAPPLFEQATAPIVSIAADTPKPSPIIPPGAIEKLEGIVRKA